MPDPMIYIGTDNGDDAYEVELFDHVEVKIDGWTFDGQVVRIHPQIRKLTVRYLDTFDVAKSTGEGRTKSARVGVTSVTLIRRDG